MGKDKHATNSALGAQHEFDDETLVYSVFSTVMILCKAFITLQLDSAKIK